MGDKKEKIDFPGFSYWDSRKQFLKYPMILQEYWHQMTGSEQKVLDFIIRQTFGWRKQSDTIALKQFTDGIKKNRGTGLSRSQVKRAISGLEKKGFIEVERRNRRPSKFTLRVSDEAKNDRKLELRYSNTLSTKNTTVRIAI
jgi:hypothetical protein